MKHFLQGGHLIYVNGVEDRPRELNSLVRVYGRNGAPSSYGPTPDGRSTGVFSRTESGRNQMNPEQLQQFRQGLANDMKFLEQRQQGNRSGIYIFRQL